MSALLEISKKNENLNIALEQRGKSRVTCPQDRKIQLTVINKNPSQSIWVLKSS